MSKTLNFNNVSKRYLTVTFADENKTTIMVGTPTKRLLEELVNLESSITITNTEDDFGALDELYGVCAKLMNRNKGGVTITREFLEENFDYEDILIFLRGYMSFITEISNSKN